MEIRFYKSTLDPKTCDKTSVLSNVILTKQVNFKQNPKNLKSFDLELDISADDVTFNYAYVTSFGRYYFVGEPESLMNGRCRIPLRCDVLFTHLNKILSTTQIVSRNAKYVNGYIEDSSITCAAYDTINCVAFPNAMQNNDSIILITAG